MDEMIINLQYNSDSPSCTDSEDVAKKKKRVKRFERINPILSSDSEDKTGNIITTCAIIETPIDQVSPVNRDRRIMEHNGKILIKQTGKEIKSWRRNENVCHIRVKLESFLQLNYLKVLNAAKIVARNAQKSLHKTSVRNFATPFGKLQKEFLLKRIIIKPVQTTRKSVPIEKQRSSSREYGFYKNKTVFERVCKNYFMFTLCISTGPIETAVKHVDDHGVFTKMDNRGRQAPANKTPGEQIQEISQCDRVCHACWLRFKGQALLTQQQDERRGLEGDETLHSQTIEQEVEQPVDAVQVTELQSPPFLASTDERESSVESVAAPEIHSQQSQTQQSTPNSTQLTQPLDVAFFGSLKKTWRKILTNYKVENPRQASLNKCHFPPLLNKVMDDVYMGIRENVTFTKEKQLKTRLRIGKKSGTKKMKIEETDQFYTEINLESNVKIYEFTGQQSKIVVKLCGNLSYVENPDDRNIENYEDTSSEQNKKRKPNKKVLSKKEKKEPIKISRNIDSGSTKNTKDLEISLHSDSDIIDVDLEEEDYFNKQFNNKSLELPIDSNEEVARTVDVIEKEIFERIAMLGKGDIELEDCDMSDSQILYKNASDGDEHMNKVDLNSRGHSERRYLPAELSINKMWKMYNKQLNLEANLKVKKGPFRKIFNNNYNLGFGSPRTDVCSTCILLLEKIKRESDEAQKQRLMVEHRVHKLKAKAFFNLVREERPNLKTFSFDCEKNLPLPKTPDQITYYSKQLYLYNCTIVEGSSKAPLTTQNVFAYCWTEDLYAKGANAIAQTDLTDISTIRLIADGCPGQNKNSIMIAMCSKWLSSSAPDHVQRIEIVFPIVGHSFIPPDRVFAHVEKDVRKLECILRPEDYLEIIGTYSTIVRMGSDCEVLNIKSGMSSVIKDVGSWHFQFKHCKRFLIQRSKEIGNVVIQGEVHYTNNLGVLKKITRKNKKASD
ncbi:unnamed protein product [Parnassius apollo]|uniref:(apollo) hypothetical protein n=1 Tax=Parnassius apollo TaxID=110799 RepID=A0A8S3WBS1_PARAO|nr:unnamed protein product [Parnassius apollo]